MCRFVSIDMPAICWRCGAWQSEAALSGDHQHERRASEVEQSEQALANLVKESEREVGDRTARIAGAREILQQLFSTGTPEGGDSLAWARREAERSDGDLLAAASALEALTTSYEVLVRRHELYDAARVEVARAEVRAEAATAALTQVGAAGSVADSETLAVLEAASRLLSAARHPEACPLCHGTEHVADLETRVRERLSVMSSLRAARGRQSDANRALADAQTRLAQLVRVPGTGEKAWRPPNGDGARRRPGERGRTARRSSGPDDLRGGATLSACRRDNTLPALAREAPLGVAQAGTVPARRAGPRSASVGPSLVRSTSEIERLRKVLKSEEDDFDWQAACGKAGVVLEAMLDFLTELYKCKLPRMSRNEWTLGDLFPAIGRKLRPRGAVDLRFSKAAAS